MQGSTRRCAALVLAALGLAATAAAADARVTHFEGAFRCFDRGVRVPVEGAKVEFWARGWEWLPTAVAGRVVATSRTDSNGRYAFDSPPDDDRYFARMLFEDRNNIHLKDWYVPWVFFEDGQLWRNDEPSRWMSTIDLGDGAFRTPVCSVFRGMHAAAEGYLAEGLRLPFPDMLTTVNDPLTGQVPYTAHTALNWPPGFPAGTTPVMVDKAVHEFAHATRHGLDGNLGHFLFDATVRWWYLRQHQPCDRTNEGFAFNEGWAEYWSGEVTSPPECRDSDNNLINRDDMRVEGMVAAKLLALQQDCGFSRAQMVGVLARSPERIHSFNEFADVAGCRPLSDRAQTGQVVQEVRGVTLATRMREVSTTISAINVSISSLTRQLGRATRVARSVGPCLRSPCDAALRASTLPPALAGQLAILRVIRRELRRIDTRRELKSATLKRPILSRTERRLRSRIRSGVLRAARTMFTRIVAAARRSARIDPQGTAAPFLADMQGKLAALRSEGTAALPGWLPSRLIRPRKADPVPPSDFNAGNPNQPQPPSQPTPESLSLTCPSGGSAAAPIPVEGALSPTVNGATVSLAWSNGSASDATQVTTDEQGRFAASLASLGAGTYTIEANYAGDSGHGSAAASCTVELK